MAFECEYCDKEFNTNAGLYMHKQSIHNPPKVVIVNHRDANAGFSGDHVYSRKRHIIDDEVPGPSNIEEEIDFKKKFKSDDDNTEVIDIPSDDDDMSLDLPDVPTTDLIPKFNIPKDKMKNKIKISDSWKIKYERCQRQSIRQREKYNKLKDSYNKLKDIYDRGAKNFNDKIAQMVTQCATEIDKLKTDNAKKISDSEKVIEDMKREHINIINNIQRDNETNLKNLMDECDRRINAMEQEHNQKIKELNDYIKEIPQEDTEHFNSLSKAIFNCTSMEEIFEVRRLIKDHKFDEVLKNHIGTIQKLFMGLSYGIIPICNAQRTGITNKQRDLVDAVQSSTSTTAKNLLKTKRNEVTKLFSIINDSLKLIRNTYNTYGSHDEDQ